MVPLPRFEKRLERMVEGAFSRAFRSELRPVEIGRRVTREMDLAATVGVKGDRVAPNRMVVRISPADHQHLAALGDTLITELAEAIEEHAARERYSLKGPASVSVVADVALRTGELRVEADIYPGARPTKAMHWLVLPDGGRLPILDDDPVTIGRLPECDVVLLDPNVSRRHTEVRIRKGVAAAIDLESLNGTKVNGRGVARNDKGQALTDGDVIQVGAALFRYERSGESRS